MPINIVIINNYYSLRACQVDWSRAVQVGHCCAPLFYMWRQSSATILPFLCRWNNSHCLWSEINSAWVIVCGCASVCVCVWWAKVYIISVFTSFLYKIYIFLWFLFLFLSVVVQSLERCFITGRLFKSRLILLLLLLQTDLQGRSCGPCSGHTWSRQSCRSWVHRSRCTWVRKRPDHSRPWRPRRGCRGKDSDGQLID